MPKKPDNRNIDCEPAPALFDIRRRSGDFLFAAASFGLALFLLIRLPDQTRWFDRVDLLLQPRLWPSVVLGAFALFSGLYLIQSWRARKDPEHLDPSHDSRCGRDARAREIVVVRTAMRCSIAPRVVIRRRSIFRLSDATSARS